jgi:hypothetical protein
MKKNRFKHQKTEDSGGKFNMKFRDFDDDDSYGLGDESRGKRRKDTGKRQHRKKTMKDEFWESDKH